MSWLLAPLMDRIGENVMYTIKLHADDTPVRVVAPGTGKTSTARLGVYLRDNRLDQGRTGAVKAPQRWH